MVVVIGSDFGRTNFYNSAQGKDHWPIGSFIIMEKNQPWAGRAVGETDGAALRLPGESAHPSSRRPGRHHHLPEARTQGAAALLGIANTPGAQRFPFNNTEDFAFFG